MSEADTGMAMLRPDCVGYILKGETIFTVPPNCDGKEYAPTAEQAQEMAVFFGQHTLKLQQDCQSAIATATPFPYWKSLAITGGVSLAFVFVTMSVAVVQKWILK